MSKPDDDLQQLVHAFNDAYAKGDPGWFSYFADDATVYSNGAPEPTVGREVYRKQFEKTLTTEKRAVNVVQQDEQIMGDTAIVMQHLDISMAQMHLSVRESTIWKRIAGTWKVAHLNTSVISAEDIRASRAVRVLNEKIALVSSQAGVAQ
jgi:ketosteroid isomerase-like protein